ncbi:ABC transporter substrate-binding protein [Devosia nitrariae]|uniref:ABC transporter substrate-binding protein n=1 Tax=Devosia nitrariae TaxID=2071872 RepID=A0ABQ5WAM4_9HYPH|nr:substrate-binding domain-containing protein [Devosia nitrariae]GLQ57012.1 ABC transporter substrate-binding protein [Devosia nitrariae]
MYKGKLTRRDVLRGSAATGAGLLFGAHGLPVLGQDAAPELDLPQGAAGKLTVIHRTEYFEAAQAAFRDTVTKFAAANNAELDISTTNPESFGDFLGKMSAAVRAGNPPDFAYTSNVSIPQMHLLDLLEDVTDVVEEAVAKYGNIMPGLNAARTGQFDGVWKAVPFIGTTTGFFFRGDKLREAGIDPANLKTFDDRREAALAISGPDFYGWGLTPNQSGDGFGYLTLLIQAFGGHFTDETGQIVQFDTPETVAAVEWLRETYDRNGKYAAMLPPGVESWTDTSNNEAFLAGQIGYTHNAFSVYAQAKRDDNPVYPDIVLLNAPTANNGDSRDGGNVGGWLTIFKGSKNVDLAKQLALDLLDPVNFTPMSELGGVLFTPAYADLWTDQLLASDPNLATIKEQVSVEDPFLGQSWPADPNAGVDAIRAQGVVEQMVANVIAGRMQPADAVRDAHQKMVDIFEEGGIMQP